MDKHLYAVFLRDLKKLEERFVELLKIGKTNAAWSILDMVYDTRFKIYELDSKTRSDLFTKIEATSDEIERQYLKQETINLNERIDSQVKVLNEMLKYSLRNLSEDLPN